MRSPPRDVVLVVRGFVHNTASLRPRLELLSGELGRAMPQVDAFLRRGADVALFVAQLDIAALPGPDPMDRLANQMRELGGELIDLATTSAEHAGQLRE